MKKKSHPVKRDLPIVGARMNELVGFNTAVHVFVHGGEDHRSHLHKLRVFQHILLENILQALEELVRREATQIFHVAIPFANQAAESHLSKHQFSNGAVKLAKYIKFGPCCRAIDFRDKAHQVHRYKLNYDAWQRQDDVDVNNRPNEMGPTECLDAPRYLHIDGHAMHAPCSARRSTNLRNDRRPSVVVPQCSRHWGRRDSHFTLHLEKGILMNEHMHLQPETHRAKV
mmetsp:Transcript_22457/g.43716  ORF Transcript_22457/g.43716 Transcript_22457/m.43716 type:complete len:228 (+) Transcript_22457:851-1534(+)